MNLRVIFLLVISGIVVAQATNAIAQNQNHVVVIPLGDSQTCTKRTENALLTGASGGDTAILAYCEANEVPVSGGYFTEGDDEDCQIVRNHFLELQGKLVGWEVYWRVKSGCQKFNGQPLTGIVSVLCCR